MAYGHYVKWEVVLPQHVVDETGKETADMAIFVDENTGTYEIFLDDKLIAGGDTKELAAAIGKLADWL